MTRQEFITLAQGVQPDLRRWLLALCCGNASRADDLAQETLISAYLSISRLRSDESFRAWVMSIAYRQFISSSRRIRETEPIECASSVATDSDIPCRYDHLYAALATLSPKERSALLLFYIQGYSISEISQITSSSDSAVKQLLSRGRQHLKIQLSND